MEQVTPLLHPLASFLHHASLVLHSLVRRRKYPVSSIQHLAYHTAPSLNAESFRPAQRHSDRIKLALNQALALSAAEGATEWMEKSIKSTSRLVLRSS